MPVIYYYETGYGVHLHNAGKDYIWNAHSFNPNSTDQGITYPTDWNSATYARPWEVYNLTSSFDCTGFQSGNEVVMGVAVVQLDGAEPTQTWTHRIKYGSTILYTATYTINTPSPYASRRGWAFVGIGIRDIGAREIDRNGTYTYEVIIGALSVSQNFTVSNLDTTQVTTKYTPGFIWVEGEYLWYINYHQTKTYARHDGSSYGNVGVANAGSIWISSTERKICYVDSSGNLRKTKTASRYRNSVDSSIGGLVGTQHTGHIWVASGDDHFLYFIDYEGYVSRVGPGYLYGDMQ